MICTAGILATVPIARTVQHLVYDTVGREFFTYSVLFAVITALTILLFLFIFKLKVKKVSQYIWLFICAGLYVHFTFQLKAHPEEAIHFLEYGLLSYFLLRALNQRIRDWTVYVTTVLFVLFVGTIDEFLQWMIPRRFFDFRDVGLNMLAGGIFLLAVWKGIRPKITGEPLSKFSVKMLAGIITVNLVFLGLCLSNTPSTVNRYSAAFNALSWLRNEEPMADFGYKHKDPEIGTFYSGLTLEKLRDIDLTNGELYGKVLPRDAISVAVFEKMLKVYTPNTDPFLYEFLVHLFQRDSSFTELKGTHNQNKKIIMSKIAFGEHILIEKYFGNTLKYSGFAWPDEKVKKLKNTAFLRKGDYLSRAVPRIITAFSLKEALVVIFITLIAVWVLGGIWIKRLKI